MRPPVFHTDNPADPWTKEKQASFKASLQDAPDGDVKLASEGASRYTRRILRESSFTGAIQPMIPITANDLRVQIDPSGGEVSELGVYLCTMEPGSIGATTVPLDASPKSTTFRGVRYWVAISKDHTDEFYKSVDALALYDIDLRQVVTDLALKDLDNTKDYRWIGTVKGITGSNPDADGEGGYRQYQEISGGITRVNYKEILRPLINATLNNGVALLSRQTALEFLNWGRDEFGGDRSQDVLLKGTSALDKFEFFNTPHIASIKATLLPRGEVFTFAPADFLGQFLEYQPATIFVKKERETITTYAQTKYGAHIANNRAVARTKFLF